MDEPNLKKRLVLIVDDVPRNLQVLGSALKNDRIEIAAALNGRQALSILEKAKPDLILLDVMMPEMDGFETMKYIKENPETTDIPVIFLTARTEIEDVVKGLELGAVDYITKPFNRVELLTRVHNHLELKYSRDALRDANAAKDKFFSIISHDIRTPFAVIIGFAEYLAEHSKTMEKNRLLELSQDILSVSRQAHQLFENLLQWARSQAGRIEFKPEKVEFKRLVDENIQYIKNRANEKGIQLNVTIPENLTVYGDRNMLHTIFRNLTSNAVKFTRPGGNVRISAEPEKDSYIFCVEDTGVGMPDDIRKKLFRIDEHVSTAGTEQEEGSGLGLILVKEFVEKHGGSIWVESEPGKGSRFHIRMPA
ncbi:hybrid sensor histidine kinase/response regulator [bacterium]|nr:hybrid sensor histidine kinase/response regulator [bacterium]